MHPMLTMTNTNYDYDYDTVQPYFLDGEEDFHPPPRSQLLPGPSEDIWKKFELLQTTPLSSSWTPSMSEVPLSAADHLEMVSDLLDEDCNPSNALLQSSIIQDCMWSSSFAAAKKLEKVVSERLATFQARQGTSTVSNKAADQQIFRSQMSSRSPQGPHISAGENVDPTMVLQCSTMDEKQDNSGELMKLGSELCLDSRPPSSCDSESEEELGDAEEEEEIDVVTVERRKAARRSNASPLVLKCPNINMLHHNYFAPQPPGKHREDTATQGKKQRTVRKCPSPGIDSEDRYRRRTHNVLERQRRNELKLSFLALREEVPSVADNDKASKVVILKKATELIQELQDEENRLLTVKDELRRRSRVLKKRLQQLRTLQ